MVDFGQNWNQTGDYQMSDEQLKVTGEDGTTYEFGTKMKVRKISSIGEDGTVTTKFVFRNGAVRSHVTRASDPLFPKLASHGADQKFGDEFAGVDDVEDCVLAFEKMSERLGRGEWSEKREGDSMAGTSMLARALVAVSGESLEVVKARLAKVDAKQKAVIAKAPKVAEQIARLKAEKEEKKGVKPEDAEKALQDFFAVEPAPAE